MAIDCWLVTVDGERVESVLDVTHGAKGFLHRQSPNTNFLRFIDPYGYTMFNRLQCHDLLDEWVSAASSLESEAMRQWAMDVSSLINRCASEYGYFIRFVGD